jgi:hypothetical protein
LVSIHRAPPGEPLPYAAFRLYSRSNFVPDHHQPGVPISLNFAAFYRDFLKARRRRNLNFVINFLCRGIRQAQFSCFISLFSGALVRRLPVSSHGR